MKTRSRLAIFGVIASTFALFIKVMRPTSIQFVIEGTIIEVNQASGIYNSSDIFIIGVSCFVLGASLIHLLRLDRSTSILIEGNSWDNIIQRLQNEDERSVVQILADEGGTIFQSQLVETSGFSKSKVSIILDRLEARGILKRRRHGMSNVVILSAK